MKYTRLLTLLALSLCLLACSLFSPSTPTPLVPRITTVAPDTKTPVPPTETATPPTPVVSTVETGQPDLTVYTHITMEGYSGGCMTTYTPLVSQVCVENRGDSVAGAFVIHAGAGDAQLAWEVEALAPHQAHCFRADVDLSGMLLQVDPNNVVAESNEDNNEWIAPLPTPPAICTETPDEATATSTPVPPTATSTPIPTPSTNLTIDSFTLEVSDLPDNGKRITFRWQTTGATRVALYSSSQLRFPIWWDNLEPDGELTHDFTYSFYPDPMMRLNAFNRKDEYVTAQQKVIWPCAHNYYFSAIPAGCPLLPATLSDAAFQQFEHGWMVWVCELEVIDNTLTNQIFVFYDNGWYELQSDTWVEGQPESDPNLIPPMNMQQPIRGFGKLWRETPLIRERLGWATDQEYGYPAHWQPEARENIPGSAYLELIDGRIIHTNNWDGGSWNIWMP